MPHCLSSLLILLLASGPALALAGTKDPAAKCSAAKRAAAAKKAAALLGCQAKSAAKGTTVDPACTAKASTKFADAFAKADGQGGCATTGDAGTVETAIDAFVNSAVFGLPGGDTKDSHKCAAAKLKATGKKAAAKLGCWAKAAPRLNVVDPACLAKAEEAFMKAFAKADAKGGCAPSQDAGTIEDLVNGVVATVVSDTNPTTSTTTPGATSTTTSTSLPTGPVSFSADVQPILTTNCAGCHVEGHPTGLDLRAGHSYALLVNVPSVECGTFDRVEPGDAEASYIVFKLRGSGPCFFGSQMPLFGLPLSDADQATIRAWIQQGALNN